MIKDTIQNIINHLEQFKQRVSISLNDKDWETPKVIYEEVLRLIEKEDRAELEAFIKNNKDEKLTSLYKYIQQERKDFNSVVKVVIEDLVQANQTEAEILTAKFIKSAAAHSYVHKAYSEQAFGGDLISLKDLSAVFIQEGGDGSVEELKEFFKTLSKSSRQEKMGNLIAYIFSGRYKTDLQDFSSKNNQNSATYQEDLANYIADKIQKADQLKIHPETGCEIKREETPKRGTAAAYYLDYFGVNEFDRTIMIGFASTNDDVTKQDTQYWEKLHILRDDLSNKDSNFIKANPHLLGFTVKPLILYSRFINDNPSGDQRDSLMERAFVNLSQEERCQLNNLKLLASFFNLKEDSHQITYNQKTVYPKIKEMLESNPFITGSDTLNYHHRFKELHASQNTYKEFNDFVVSELNKVLDVLQKGKYTLEDKLQPSFATILKLTCHTIQGLSENMVSEQFKINNLRPLVNLMQRYQDIRDNLFLGLEAPNGMKIDLTWVPENVDDLARHINKINDKNIKNQKARKFLISDIPSNDMDIIIDYLKNLDDKSFNLNEQDLQRLIKNKKINPNGGVRELGGDSLYTNYKNWKEDAIERAQILNENILKPSYQQLLEKAKEYAGLSQAEKNNLKKASFANFVNKQVAIYKAMNPAYFADKWNKCFKEDHFNIINQMNEAKYKLIVEGIEQGSYPSQKAAYHFLQQASAIHNKNPDFNFERSDFTEKMHEIKRFAQYLYAELSEKKKTPPELFLKNLEDLKIGQSSLTIKKTSI